MLVVGLTGGIGSGKSTVAKLFADLGVPIIDADDIAKALTEPNQPAFMAILNHFDQSLLLANGALDRAKLRNIIFNQPEQRRWLENLLHPLILQEMENRIKRLQSPYTIAVIPLLFESGPHLFIDRILTIDTPEHLQIERASLRDNTHETHIKTILNTQVDREHRVTKAHDVILNDGMEDHLVPQVESLHILYTQLGTKSEN